MIFLSVCFGRMRDDIAVKNLIMNNPQMNLLVEENLKLRQERETLLEENKNLKRQLAEGELVATKRQILWCHKCELQYQKFYICKTCSQAFCGNCSRWCHNCIYRFCLDHSFECMQCDLAFSLDCGTFCTVCEEGFCLECQKDNVFYDEDDSFTIIPCSKSKCPFKGCSDCYFYHEQHYRNQILIYMALALGLNGSILQTVSKALIHEIYPEYFDDNFSIEEANLPN